MTYEQIKLLCKLAVENSQKSLTESEKEILKQAIDESKTIEDIFAVALAKILM